MHHNTVSYTSAAVLTISHHNPEPINHQRSHIHELLDMLLLVLISRSHAGCKIENITISSDGNVPMPIRDEDGRQVGMYIAPLDFNRREIRDIVNNKVAPFSEALKMVTTNPVRILGIGDTKGEIKDGYDADIVIADSVENLRIEKVYAKGRIQVENGKSIFQGHYQQDPYYNQYR